MTAPPIHPRLVRIASMPSLGRFMIYSVVVLLWLLALLGGGWLLVAGEWLGGAVALSALTVAEAVRRVAARQLSSRQVGLVAASRLLYDTPPRPMRLRFDGAMGWDGYLATLSDPAAGKGPQVVRLQVGRFDLPRPGDHDVAVQWRPESGDGMVIWLGERPLIAARQGPARLRLDARRLGLLLAAAMAATLFLGAAAQFPLWREWREAATAAVRAEASRGWPRADGVVTAVGVRSRFVPSGRGRLQERFVAAVAYRYRVAGREYRSETIAFGLPALPLRAEAERLAAAYPLGRQLPVAYAPEEPALAVLEAGEGRWAREREDAAVAAIGGIAGAMAVLLTLLFFIRRRWVGRLEQLAGED